MQKILNEKAFFFLFLVEVCFFQVRLALNANSVTAVGTAAEECVQLWTAMKHASKWN